MALSPFEERYRTEVNDIFEDSNKYRKWMEVELALAKVHAELGTIPKSAIGPLEKAIERVSASRINEIEAEIHHDLMAMVKAYTEAAGDAGKYIHLGATSYDIEDTATALVFREAITVVRKNLAVFSETLKKTARTHKKTVCIGRTHGQHAVPTTYGLKFAIYYQESLRCLERLDHAYKTISVGKMAGAVGSMATFGEKGMVIQEKVMKLLGIEGAKASNQVIQRDRHAEVMFGLAATAMLLEKVAKEIRNLQRTEILEIGEAFGKKQVGSSTMPHKRNPHKSERVCSLARLVRANVAVAMENAALEHERDLTNSANERAIFSESFCATNYMLVEMQKIVSGLEFFPENIEKNLELTHGLVMAERVMIYLTEHKGIGRQDAHEKVRELAQEAFRSKKYLKDLTVERKILTEKEAKMLFDPATYIGMCEKIVEEATR